jgi:hypothetical protein
MPESDCAPTPGDQGRTATHPTVSLAIDLLQSERWWKDRPGDIRMFDREAAEKEYGKTRVGSALDLLVKEKVIDVLPFLDPAVGVVNCHYLDGKMAWLWLRQQEALRVTQEQATPPAADDGPWSKPDTPSRWARVFKVSSRTFIRWVKAERIHAKKLSDRSYQVRLTDLPEQSPPALPAPK